MSDLKKAAQAALDWADVILGNDWSARPKQRLGEVAEQLREALAQPEQSGWVGLTDEEMRIVLRECSQDTFEKLRIEWQRTKAFGRAIESALRAKNAVPDRVPIAGLVKEDVILAADVEYRKKGAGACIVQTWEDCLIRAVEEHHGIKEQK